MKCHPGPTFVLVPVRPGESCRDFPAVRKSHNFQPHHLSIFRADTVAGDRTPRRVRAAFCSGDSPRSSAAQRGDVMSPRRGGAGTRGRGSGARPRVPAFSPRLALPGILAAFAAVACAASPAAAAGAAAAGAAAGAPGAPRFRALVHVDDMDAEVVPDARDETGDGDLHARDVTLQENEKTRHAEARAASEDALADIEERLYGTLRLSDTGDTTRDTRDTYDALSDALSDDVTDTLRESRDDVASAFRELFAFVADAPSPARARAEARDAARRRAARTRDPPDAVVAAETARLFTRGEDASRAPERDDDAHGISDGFSLEQPLVASLEDLPAEWRAVADALYLLASLVELGVAPKTRDAYPPPRIERIERRSHSASHSASHKNSASPRFRATSDGHWADVHFADPSGTSVPTHPALAEPQRWAAAAVFVAAEMGSRDARLAAGDRVLRGRGAAFSFFEDENADEHNVDFDVDFACERATRVYLLPAAERAADAAEAAGDVRVPPEPPRLRARERDAGYVDDTDAEEDGDAQIEMERDMAARGVPEAERHLGYRALMGRGVARDEVDALARFRAAADLGDPLAMFNLGYMHMHGMGTGVNHTEARALFEKAASLDVAAAHNGVGVLDYNGWATENGAPNVAAARARFEAGAAAGDPDALFNLGTLYQAGAGGLPLDHAEAYARYQAASDAGHWRAPLAVAKLTLEGWDPDPVAESGGDESTRKGRVAKNCREAARLLASFLEERLAVFSDEHEDALAALEGGFVEAAAESRAGAASDSEDSEDEETSETEVGPDPWGALVRYARIAERGSEAGLANAAFLAKKAGAAKTRRSWEKEKESAFPPHLTRRAARDAARLALTRLAAAGDVEARVDLGDVEWWAAVEGDDDTNDLDGSGVGANSQKKRKASHPRPPAAPAPAQDASSSSPPPAPPREGRREKDAGGARSAGSSVTSETTFSSQKNATWYAWRITRLFSLRTPESESSVPEHESGLDRDAKPPAPAAPPRGFARTRRVAFHYQEASLLGLPEGSVSLAWCWSRGVGVPRRDLKQAEIALWKAHDDSADEMEAFAPLAAAAAVAAVNAAAAAARVAKGAFSFFAAAPSDAIDAVDLVRRLDLAFGAKETNAVLYPGSVPGTGTSPGTSPGTTSGEPTRNARGARGRDARAAAAEKNGDATRFFLRVEGCVLAVLVCGFAAIGYARFIALVGEHRDARAAFLDGLSPATVAGVAGAVAAAAWAAAA